MSETFVSTTFIRGMIYLRADEIDRLIPRELGPGYLVWPKDKKIRSVFLVETVDLTPFINW